MNEARKVCGSLRQQEAVAMIIWERVSRVRGQRGGILKKEWQQCPQKCGKKTVIFNLHDVPCKKGTGTTARNTQATIIREGTRQEGKRKATRESALAYFPAVSLLLTAPSGPPIVSKHRDPNPMLVLAGQEKCEISLARCTVHEKIFLSRGTAGRRRRCRNIMSAGGDPGRV